MFADREVVARLLSRSFSWRGRQARYAPFVGIINEEEAIPKRDEKRGDHPHAADERNEEFACQSGRSEFYPPRGFASRLLHACAERSDRVN